MLVSTSRPSPSQRSPLRRHVEAAVARLAVDAAADVLQLDAAVGGVEAHVAGDADDGDAAVDGAQVEIVLARHVDAVADRPPFAAHRSVGSGRIDAAAAGLHLHLAGDLARARGFARLAADDGADANLVAVPAFDDDAAVLAGIDIQRAGGQGRIAHFAVLLVIVVAPVASVRQGSASLPTCMSA